MKQTLMIALIFIVIYLGTSYSNTIMHENTHEQIQIYYGCINITKVVRLWGDSYSLCNEYNNRTQDEKELEYTLHSINEIVSYNMTTINMLVLLIGMVIVIVIGSKQNEN